MSRQRGRGRGRAKHYPRPERHPDNLNLPGDTPHDTSYFDMDHPPSQDLQVDQPNEYAASGSSRTVVALPPTGMEPHHHVSPTTHWQTGSMPVVDMYPSTAPSYYPPVPPMQPTGLYHRSPTNMDDDPRAVAQNWQEPRMRSSMPVRSLGGGATSYAVPDPAGLRRGMELAQRLWSTMPNRPRVQILGASGPEVPASLPRVINTGESESMRQPQREMHVAMPQTPQPRASASIPPRVSAPPPLAPAYPPPAPAHDPPPASETRTSPGPPIPGTGITTAVNLSKAQKRIVLEAAKHHIYSLLLAEEGVPSPKTKQRLIESAVKHAIRESLGGVVVKGWDMNQDLTSAMATVRRAFKLYAFPRVQREYNLRLPRLSKQEEIEHKRTHVKELIHNLAFLKKVVSTVPMDNGGQPITHEELFTGELFEDIIIDVLFLDTMQLHRFVQNQNLDQAFGLATAAIYVSLKEYKEGCRTEMSLSSEIWREPYVEAMEEIRKIRESHEGSTWLSTLQREMMEKGCIL